MSALVTGATGFVGGRLVRRLLALGRPVHVLVRRLEDARSLGDAGALLFEGDLGDPNPIADAAAGCATVFHCAGETSHRADAAALAWVNVAGTENVLNASRAAGVVSFVHLSCADVTLDNHDRLYAREGAGVATRAFNDLARTKLLAEELALHANSSSFGVSALRPAWTWGAGDSNVLPQLIREGLAGGMAMYGSGNNLVATAHVDNVVEAMLLAEQSERGRGRPLHVADFDCMTLSEFLGAMSTALGLPAPRRGLYPVAYAAARMRRAFGLDGPWPMDVVRRGRGRLLEVQSAAGLIDYKPVCSTEEGMAALAEWVAEQGGATGVAALGRTPATRETAHAQRRVADEAQASGDADGSA